MLNGVRSCAPVRCAAAVMLLAAATGGCARYSARTPFQEEARGLGRADEQVERPVVSVSGPPRITPVPVRVVESTPLTVGVEPGQVVASPGDPIREAGATPLLGTPYLIEAKVGDINGRPVFAGEFFATGPGALLAEKARAPEMTAAAWERLAHEEIMGEMRRRMTNELLQAEARASLEPEARMGLRAYLEDTAVEGKRRQAGGSRAAAERQLQEEESLSLEQFARKREGEELVLMQLRKILVNQLNVSARDLRLEYERNKEEFNPPPRARFRLIRVATDRAEEVAAIQEALDRGDPFEQVAARPSNTSNPERAGEQDKRFTGDLKTASLFGTVEPLNEAARRLSAGEWTRTPIVYDSWTAWLKLESVEIIRRPLSDESVQLELMGRIKARKIDELLSKYVSRLSQRASVGNVLLMAERLLEIARERYWAAGQ